MDPKEFGKHYWYVFHASAATATTPERRRAYKVYATEILDKLLPCDTCAMHYRMNVARYNIDDYMQSHKRLLLWSYLIHNVVNTMLGKMCPSYEACESTYLPQPGSSGVCTSGCGEAHEDVPRKHRGKVFMYRH